MKDPNLICPGSDLTNVFPEEGTDRDAPTQAQIEAAAKAIYEMVGYDMRLEPGCHDLPLRAAHAALTAAAEVGECNQSWIEKRAAIRDTAIERCAQIVAEWRKNFSTQPHSDYIDAALEVVESRIRALKNKP